MTGHGGDYEIHIAPSVGPRFAAAFSPMHVVGGSTLRGHVRDQAELHGVLAVISDLGLDLLDVTRLAD